MGTPDNGGTVSITGGGTGVQFTPRASFQDLNVGQSRISHFTYTIQDSGGTANGGVDTLSESLTISTTAVNDVPVRTAGTVANLTVLEDAGLGPDPCLARNPHAKRIEGSHAPAGAALSSSREYFWISRTWTS